MNSPTAGAETNYLKSEFLERVAHELRGPAGVTLGALNELEAALGEDATKFKALFGMARRGVQRVVRTAERLQQTGQLEGHSVEFFRELHDLAALTEEAARETEMLEARRKINVRVEHPPTLPPCSVDAKWYGVAIAEVVSNAIRHARENVGVRLEHKGATVQVIVTDDGTASEEFAPVRFQAPRARRGLGLSLAIVRDVMSAHDGSLQIDPASDTHSTGSCIRLIFPTPSTASSKFSDPVTQLEERSAE